MKLPQASSSPLRTPASSRPSLPGFSLVEMMVAVGIASIVLVVLALLSLNGLQSFLIMGNSTALDARSRWAADQITRELRQAAGVVRYEVEEASRTLVLTNRLEGYLLQYVWNAADCTLTSQKADEPPVVCLTDCDDWAAEFFQNQLQASATAPYWPATNGAGELDLDQARIVSLSWKCRCPVAGSRITTESAQTVQVALRNSVRP